MYHAGESLSKWTCAEKWNSFCHSRHSDTSVTDATGAILGMIQWLTGAMEDSREA